jgi:L-fucose mutarotase
MLKTTLLHPEILYALGSAGHGSRVLISDGNYPHSTKSNPAASHVFLNLCPGVLTATQVLEAIVGAIPIEAAQVMATADGSEPPIWSEFRAILPGNELEPLERFAFYDAASEPDVALVVATGEQRIYANILLTIGVVMPDATPLQIGATPKIVSAPPVKALPSSETAEAPVKRGRKPKVESGNTESEEVAVEEPAPVKPAESSPTLFE